MKRSVFIFNPDTDYALATGNTRYNPPSSIIKLQKEMQLIPLNLASDGDVIVVSPDFDATLYPDKSLARLLETKRITTVTLKSLLSYMERFPTIEWDIWPWGWNHSLRAKLIEAGIKESLLKSEKEIDILRQLSHRHTVIPFQEYLHTLMPMRGISIAKEFFSSDEALAFAHSNDDVFFKAPWSSSGRGLLRVTKNSRYINETKLKEWLNGFIRRQGSVMGEIAYNRIADFATEWMLKDGNAEFLGLSLFKTSDTGRYIGNSVLSQEDILKEITVLSHSRIEDIVKAQKSGLEALIAPYYSGPAGIDMLADVDGNINPCVEINLRTTMGMVELFRHKENNYFSTGNPGKQQPSLFNIDN